jgi:lipoate-protein ligase A
MLRRWYDIVIGKGQFAGSGMELHKYRYVQEGVTSFWSVDK